MTTTLEQKHEALAKANAVRLARAALKREVAALPRPEGLARLAELILDPPPEMMTAPLGDVLQWPRRNAQTLALRTLRRAGIGEMKAVGALTERQRRILARCLTDSRARPADRIAADGR